MLRRAWVQLLPRALVERGRLSVVEERGRLRVLGLV